MISDQLASVKAHIKEVSVLNERDPSEVALVGVSKYAEIDQVKQAIEAGIEHIAENRVQEAVKKFEALGPLADKVTKHMIGHLQTNKVKKALEIFDVIQSVDRLKLLREIEHQAEHLNKNVNIFIQVNISGEEQKFGAQPEEVDELLKEIVKLKHVHVVGLMTMAPHTEDKDIIRDCFRQCRLLREKILEQYKDQPNITMEYLSMGMSADYTIAIEEGSNMVRIGTAIFKG